MTVYTEQTRPIIVILVLLVFLTVTFQQICGTVCQEKRDQNVFVISSMICSSNTCCPWVVTKRNSRIYPTSTVACKFTRFESSWLVCETIARKGVENVSLTCTNWNSDWEQRGASRPKAGLVASLIAPEQWCMLSTPSIATFQVSQGSVETLFRW